MNHITIAEFLTEAEIARALALWRELQGTGRFARTLDAEIITPNLARINAKLGQENDARYLAYAVEAALTQLTETSAALGGMAEDVCQVCGAHIGYGVRALHLGLCDTCRNAPTH